MAVPSPDFSPFSEVESPIEQTAGLFFDSTESYFEAIQAGMVASHGARDAAVHEVSRRAELMASSVQILAGILFDRNPTDSEKQLVDTLYTNECMQANFYAKHMVKRTVLADGISDIANYIRIAKEKARKPELPDRTIFVEAAKLALLSNSYIWMKMLGTDNE